MKAKSCQWCINGELMGDMLVCGIISKETSEYVEQFNWCGDVEKDCSKYEEDEFFKEEKQEASYKKLF